MLKTTEPPKPLQLLVEGKNDQHVILALRERHQLPKTFSVEPPPEKDGQGIEILLASLPLKLKQENLRTLGIVVDADRDLSARWQAVRDRLSASGYQRVPKSPPADGWVYPSSEDSYLPRVGVWLMPNNQLPGMLEDFVAYLIPSDDALLPKAEAILQEIEQAQLNRYTLIHHPKALIHTWLAWQKKPEITMGQAITARVLSYDSAIALTFIAWLKLLFELPTTSG